MDHELAVESVREAASFFHDDFDHRYAKSVLSVIASSKGRALSIEKHSGAAARFSISCAAMSLAYELSRTRDLMNGYVAQIFDAALALGGGAGVKHVPRKERDDQPPHGWTGAEGGPFAMASKEEHVYTIARHPQMPGGDWVFHINGVPSAYGVTPKDTADRGLSFLMAVASSRKMRRPRSCRSKALSPSSALG